MKNIKDITISIFAIIGFAFLLSSFTPNGAEETEQQVYGTPESHVWELMTTNDSRVYRINKVTGETNVMIPRKNSKGTIGLVSYKPQSLEYGEDKPIN
jgi:hypothetical protein